MATIFVFILIYVNCQNWELIFIEKSAVAQWLEIEGSASSLNEGTVFYYCVLAQDIILCLVLI